MTAQRGKRRELPKRSRWSYHRQDARASLLRLLASPIASGMTLLVIAIALLLPALLFVVEANLTSLMGQFRDSARLTAYLQDALTEAEAVRVSNDLLSLEGIADVTLITREEALESFSAAAGFDRAIAALDSNPLPATLVIQPASPALVPALAEQIAALPEVALLQVDEQWIARLNVISRLVATVATVLAVVIALGLILIIGNTVRVSIEQRRDEIRVIKLVGGTDSFIARPFLYSGLLQGFFGALLALLLLLLIYGVTRGALTAVSAEFGNNLSIQGLGVVGSLQLLLFGALVGWLAAVFSAWRAIREIDA